MGSNTPDPATDPAADDTFSFDPDALRAAAHPEMPREQTELGRALAAGIRAGDHIFVDTTCYGVPGVHHVSGEHVLATVFMGPREGETELCGTLVMKPDDWAVLAELLHRAAIDTTGHAPRADAGASPHRARTLYEFR